jgi:hypothetical protein
MPQPLPGPVARAVIVATASICASALPILAAPKFQITFFDDAYAVHSTTNPGWIKFTILTSDLNTVYFQNSNQYPFHYDFAVAELPQFQGMTRTQFDQVTLHATGQQAILGAVIFPPTAAGGGPLSREYGIEFVGLDPYPSSLIRDLFFTVRSRVIANPEAQALYFPAFEQQATAAQNEAYFTAEGITISSTERWATGNSCYSFGWALGRLVYLPPTQIDAAWLAGTLTPDDILLTDGVPAEVPAVAGVISLAPATPNSHVVILSQTFRLPFVYLALAGDAAKAQSFVGRQVLLRADDYQGGCRLRLVDVDGELDQATLTQIRALKQPPPLNIAAMQSYGAYSANASTLVLSDISRFGGKAANFGTIRRAIPASSPVATAFSFDLWNRFLDQLLANGRTLRAEIALRLAPFAWPPDMSDLDTVLVGIQDLIKDTAQTTFSSTLQNAVVATLQDPQYGFDPLRNLRFRSSTNVEDADQFTGAGLYDSYSGCLADDLDSNSSGPSLCDSSESSERGVFRAIRRVFASFYNLNAYLERLRYHVNEAQVGMAMLVHHSFPDPIELANGVALFERQSAASRSADLVTQTGASSVTNPEPGAIPEVVKASISSSGTVSLSVRQYSNLLPLGAKVMTYPSDYQNLTNLLALVAERYVAESGLSSFTLDFEYKKLAPNGSLSVDQVRRVPQPSDAPSITPFLINAPGDYCLLQGESEVGPLGLHRLKSRFTFSTRNLWLTPANLTQSFFADSALEYGDSCQLYEESGPLSQWPAAVHGFASGTATDGWSFASLQVPRAFSLRTDNVPTLVAPSASAILVLADLGWFENFDRSNGCLFLDVGYAQPVPEIDPTDSYGTTTSAPAHLCRCLTPDAKDVLQQRVVNAPGGVSIVTRFYWRSGNAVAGYTAPLSRFVDTVITGLTTTTLTLTDEHAQTYKPYHHNFSEHFVFEPGLDPGVTATQRAELQSRGIRGIVLYCNGSGCTHTLYNDSAWGGACLGCTGFDGDHDGHCTASSAPDCNDADSLVWQRPGEVPDVGFVDRELLTWGIPSAQGRPALQFDVLRSANRSDFGASAICLESDDDSDLGAFDGSIPGPGAVFYYLVRAQNTCDGSLGYRSNGVERTGRSCP